MVSLESFKSWLRKGLGRAVIFVGQNSGSPYREAVLHACFHNLSYEPELEEGRGEYLWMLIEHAGEQKLFRDAVFEHLSRPPDESEEYDWSQIFSVAQQFAKEGDSEMRQAMYRAFDHLGFETAGASSATSLINLDGWEGFVFAVNRFNRFGPENDWWMVESLMTDLESRVGKQEAERLIAGALGSDTSFEKVIRAYQQYGEEQRQRNEAVNSEPVKLEALKNMPADRSWASRFRRWSLKATDEELSTATRDFLSDMDVEKVCGCLRAFANHPFPGDATRLLELSDSDDDRVRRAAVVALSRIRDPRIRARGLMLLNSDERFTDGIELLESNYEQPDFHIFEQVITRTLSIREVHEIGITVTHVVEKGIWPELEQVLLFLYEAGPCSLCRTNFVTALIKLERLPDAIRDECRFDADPDTRQAVCASIPC